MTCDRCGRFSPTDRETGYDADAVCPDCQDQIDEAETADALEHEEATAVDAAYRRIHAAACETPLARFAADTRVRLDTLQDVETDLRKLETIWRGTSQGAGIALGRELVAAHISGLRAWVDDGDKKNESARPASDVASNL